MKAYTYNDRLVGVGNDQILGTDQGGGSTYTAGDYISIDNDEISVTGISAGNGTLSIVQNVTGAPLEITYPTDVAPDAVFYQINSVTGNAYSSSTSNAVINYYYGETPADFNGSDDSILFTINDNISNIGAIYFYYTTDATSYGGPYLSPAYISGGSSGIVQSGTYKLKAQYNQAGTSSPYGKYLQIVFNWRNYATDAAQSLQWAQEALSKITFFGVVRPDPSLGVNVNLDRYYLGGNVVTNKPTNSGLPAQIWLNPETKKQEVYLPNTVPSSWNIYGNNFYNYTNTPTSINGGSVSNYIAYKYDSATGKYIYARMTSSIFDTTNNIKKSEFVTLEPVNGNFEKWTYDYSNSSNRHWTTETITQDMSDYATEAELQAVSGALDNYIPYAASGVYLPNSKFEIDTNGQAYKVITAGSETDYNSYYDGYLCYGYYGSLPVITETPRVMKAGTYRITINNDNIKSLKLNSYGNFSSYNGLVLPVIDNRVDLIITQDVQVTTSNDRLYIGGYTNSDGTGSWVQINSSNDVTVKYIVSAVTEEYITESDLELNGDDQVTAIDGHALAAGSNYTAGQYVSIDSNDVISVTGLAPVSGASGIVVEDSVVSLDNPIGLVAGDNITIEVSGVSAIISSIGGTQVQADWTETNTSDPSYIQNKPTIPTVPSAGNMLSVSNDTLNVTTTAGITDIVSVTALPANPVATVIYLIPES